MLDAKVLIIKVKLPWYTFYSTCLAAFFIFLQDVDPLSDTGPPRHAIESDDEDDFNPLSKPSETVQPEPVIEIIGSDSTSGNLIVAAGDAGRWVYLPFLYAH